VRDAQREREDPHHLVHGWVAESLCERFRLRVRCAEWGEKEKRKGKKSIDS
jgi:hypothetical protein